MLPKQFSGFLDGSRDPWLNATFSPLDAPLHCVVVDDNKSSRISLGVFGRKFFWGDYAIF